MHHLDIPKYSKSYTESAPLEVTLLYIDPEFRKAWKPAFKGGYTTNTLHSEAVALLIQL